MLQAIEKQAKALGKTKTDLVIEALAQVYDLPVPDSETSLDSIQQQLDALRQQMSELTGDAGTQQTLARDGIIKVTSAIQEVLQVFQVPPLPDNGQPDFSIVHTAQLEPYQPPAAIRLLDMDMAHSAEQIALQVEYQMQIFDQIFSAIPDLVFICDRFGHFTYVSPIGGRVWGLDRTQVLGHLCYEAELPSEFTEFYLSQMDTTLSFGKQSFAELRVFTTGGPRYFEYTLSPIRSETGEIIGTVGIASDITHRKETELALQESLEKYKNLFELANDMIFIIDVETHRIIDANQKASRRLRYTRKELTQLKLEDIETTEATDYFQVYVIPQLEKAGSHIFVHQLRRKDATTITVEVSIRLIEYGDRLAYQSFARDVSERQKLTDAVS
ncbi:MULTISPECIES: PAS domain-containing protein [unclassified Leptolyngbya]|uniref:PAS domain-containing protein n=1 Tax=unclassified Leptolyngbya TaxID=2650499 RepID=UPI00168948F5|nr:MULTISPECIES: PAS domain-containing protein [unclassified Leptolyngbya]MBD1909680.1 PAS domain S-box protein [Leptolyngbya sp. FACHB-8]MBD2157543.1 PAS domain S-box protein [Leptolyngbya sp. FACHB-16]